MARIAGVDLPNHKRIDIALTYIYGIGRRNVQTLLTTAKIEAGKKVGTLTEEDVGRIMKVLDKDFKIEGDLKIEVTENIKRLKEIGCYRGIRHVKNLPVHGQRTRVNARTKRGKRQTVGALRKDMRAKMTTPEPAAK